MRLGSRPQFWVRTEGAARRELERSGVDVRAGQGIRGPLEDGDHLFTRGVLTPSFHSERWSVTRYPLTDTASVWARHESRRTSGRSAVVTTGSCSSLAYRE